MPSLTNLLTSGAEIILRKCNLFFFLKTRPRSIITMCVEITWILWRNVGS